MAIVTIDPTAVSELQEYADLTDTGAAVVALLRFSDLFAALEPADRAYFADELAQLAWEALGRASALAGSTAAQGTVPSGAFARDSAGNTWLVVNGTRYGVAMHPADDATIAALPDSGLWLIPSAEAGLTYGERPAWGALAPPPFVAPSSPAVAAPAARTASDEGLTLTVLSVERDWKSTDVPVKPKDGMEFFTVEVRLDNAGGQARDFNVASFEVTLADDTRWGTSFVWSRRPSLHYGQLTPGQAVRGWITLEVPRGSQVTQLLWRASYSRTVSITL